MPVGWKGRWDERSGDAEVGIVGWEEWSSSSWYCIFDRTMGLVRAIQRPLTTARNVDRTTDMPPRWVEEMDRTQFN